MCFLQYKLILTSYTLHIHIVLITCLMHISVSRMQFQQPYNIMNDLKDNSGDTSSSYPRSLKNVNISSYLWQIFQSRNQHFRQMHKPVLYYSPNNDDNNNATWRALNNSDIFNHNNHNNNNKHLQSYNTLQTPENVNTFRRMRGDHQQSRYASSLNLRSYKEMLHRIQLSALMNQIPPIPNERPFHEEVLLNHNEMMRLLGRHNFDSEFMSFNKPWEAIIYPSGRLVTSDLVKENADKRFETMVNRRRNRRSRKLPSHRRYFTSDIYNDHLYDERRGVGESKQEMSSNSLFQNAMHRLKLIQSLKEEEKEEKNEFHERLMYVDSEHLQRSSKQLKRNKKLRRILREFLNDFISCPLYYIWYDWGPKFWPRWIKAGKCVNIADISCSFPPGMYCQEKSAKDIVLLRYICPESWPISSCNWYRIHLPIVMECSCGCTDRTESKPNS
ncbi:unnamed protein product [Trichobilharzia szidati]|nr:unnamed protein product [Trichobilharzia szidati]